jgi:hypothetical protein
MKVGDLVKLKENPRPIVTYTGPGGMSPPDDALGIVVDLDGGHETWVTVAWGWRWNGEVCKNFIRDLEVVSGSR